MSEEALWYVARIAGLMTWILAFGSLSAGLLVKARREDPTPATQWAVDTHRFLGVCSVLALLAHSAAVVFGSRSDLSVIGALIGYQRGSWLSVALLIGVICGWMLVLLEVGRAVNGRLHAMSGEVHALLEVLTTLFAFAVVGGGAYHAWVVGSDARNVITLIVAALATAVLTATAALGALSLFRTDRQRATSDVTVPSPAGRNAGGHLAGGRSLGTWSVSDNDQKGPQITSARDVSRDGPGRPDPSPPQPPPPQHRRD